MRIRKGDMVQVLSGKDRGRTGQVMAVLVKADKVIVDRANLVRRHTKPRSATLQGGIIDKDMPVPASNVAIVCPNDGPTRIGIAHNDAGVKIRVCRKCGVEL